MVKHAWAKAARWTAVAALLSGAVGAGGCLERPLERQEPRPTVAITEKLTQSSVDKIDIVLAIDNSRSMADKQQILALAVPDLVTGLVNPSCIDPDGNVAPGMVGPTDECPNGYEREFDPVADIHIGVISSSLGGHGADACATGTGKQSNNDAGHLIDRLDASDNNVKEPTYQGQGFLAWDPKQKLNPPGEADIDDPDTATDPTSEALVPSLRNMLIGTGQIGCGYESQLEAVYRFLIDPNPYKTITLDADGRIVLNDTDDTVITQRRQFMRPDSLLAVVMLTDENDCSIRESGQFYLAAQQKTGSGGAYHLPKARAVCETNPNDECCFSCQQKKDGCAEDPTCKNDQGKTVYHDDLSDHINLRCFDQKRRFGIDFLYSTQRYIDALRSRKVTDRNGLVVDNPLYSDLIPDDDNSSIRDEGLVFFAGIVGVPWQDIARTNSNGVPDLKLGIKSSDEMNQPISGQNYNTWDLIIGDPENYVPPTDPLMIESWQTRSGVNPILGSNGGTLVTSQNPLANKINGHEYDITAKRDDLQYACIFPLKKVVNGVIQDDVRDCSQPNLPSCDCQEPDNDNPLCEDNGMGERTNQVAAKAYPGIRILQVIRGLGSQGIVGSVCPAQLEDINAKDFGYRPAIGAIVDRLKQALGGQCLSRTLVPDENGQVNCLVLEARKVDEDQVKACNACDQIKGRQLVSEEHQAAIKAAGELPEAEAAGWNCFCEISQLVNTDPLAADEQCDTVFDQAGKELCACQYTPAKQPVQAGGTDVHGWCYVDGDASLGDASIVANCPDTEKRLIRFVGDGEAQPGATLLISCVGDNQQ